VTLKSGPPRHDAAWERALTRAWGRPGGGGGEGAYERAWKGGAGAVAADAPRAPWTAPELPPATFPMTASAMLHPDTLARDYYRPQG